ncbi:hypothetical protein O3M35_001405 [Rhynocoris fuscipes]|uniref:HTH CENPB-type domain-containing protein n=1 Tax=Rhynocoris fuscipes TaxID=488301 RepID=A0AAW1CU36_9HEMI
MEKVEKIKKFAYPQAKMIAALQDVSNGMPVATAAKKHQVPRVTLLYKSKGKTPIERRMGPPSILTQDEENELVLWISSMCEAGFPVTKTYILNYVQRLVRKLNRPNPFTGDRPGKSWYQNFLKRNPCISSRLNENLIISRTGFSKESLGKWFSNTYNYLEENGCAFVLNEPERLFNCDETGILLNPKDAKNLKNKKQMYQSLGGDKENMTVFMAGNAAGQLVPPMIICKHEEMSIDVVNSAPEQWSIGRSESGWMTSELFYEFLANVFVPWLRENNIELPVVLFTDGHALHLCIETSRFCQENQIILVALHLNTAHFLQPLDMSVFKALKTNWNCKLNQWKLLNMDTPILPKKDFAPLLKEALNDINPQIVSQGFKITGLYPWDPDIPLRLSPIDKVINQQMASSSLEDHFNALIVLEKYIAPDKLALFKQTNVSIETADTSLYEVWKKITDVVQSQGLDTDDPQKAR